MDSRLQVLGNKEEAEVTVVVTWRLLLENKTCGPESLY
jgi:hypothetical protein